MTIDDQLICNGLDVKDKADWDGSYPYYEPTKQGFLIHLSKKAKMPGVFTDRERAEMAYRRYRGKILEANLRIESNKEK